MDDQVQQQEQPQPRRGRKPKEEKRTGEVKRKKARKARNKHSIQDAFAAAEVPESLHFRVKDMLPKGWKDVPFATLVSIMRQAHSSLTREEFARIDAQKARRELNDFQKSLHPWAHHASAFFHAARSARPTKPAGLRDAGRRIKSALSIVWYGEAA